MRTVTLECVGGPVDGELLPVSGESVIVLEWHDRVVRHVYRVVRDETGSWLAYSGSAERELQTA